MWPLDSDNSDFFPFRMVGIIINKGGSADALFLEKARFVAPFAGPAAPGYKSSAPLDLMARLLQ